jgi:putative cofactor-binding repeat protein
MSASPIARSLAAAATASGWSRSRATSPATSSGRSRHRGRIVRRAGPDRSRNTITDTNDNGIEILRTAIGDDGTLVIDNRIEDIANTRGGSGQYGNAINVFRAANVIVRGNRISRAAFSAVRGNAASNIQIVGNTATEVGEVAIYSEFGFEGAVIANNTVDGAAVGVSAAISTKAAASRSCRATSSAICCRSGRSARARRRRRDRHLCRGGFIGDRQRDRTRPRSDHRRLG